MSKKDNKKNEDVKKSDESVNPSTVEKENAESKEKDKEKDKEKASSKKEKKSKNPGNNGKLSLGKRIIRYFKDLKSEFNKVVWPTKKQVFNNTIVVLVTMVVLGLFLFGLDTGLLKILELLLN